MQTRNMLVAVALVGLGAAIGWVSAPGGVSAADGALTAQDYAEIEQLYWSYNHGSDFRDADLFLSAFTADAVFKVGPRTFSGRDELAAYRVERHAGQTGDTGLRHWNNSWRIVPTADGAEARVYFLVVNVGGGQPVTAASGYYDDTYVKTADGWRFKTRTINIDGAD